MSLVNTAELFHVGDIVRIKDSIRSPYAGQTGKIFEMGSSATGMEYLVLFPDTLAYRYCAEEMEPSKLRLKHGRAS
jgi:hypothetical protein